MKKLNDGLRKRQEFLREKTNEKVEKAIKELLEEGFEVSTKLLMERTGLSRPVFGKEHVLEILKRYRVCRYKEIKKVSKNSDKNYASDLERQVRELSRDLSKARELIDKYNKRNIRLELEIHDLKETNELLRGELKLNYEKALAHGVNLDFLE